MTARQTVQPLAAELIDRFKRLFKDPPEWAWPFKPSIPFVGKQYRPGRSLLIYASAENFTWMKNKPTPDRFTTNAAWNRYRVCYEESGRNNPGLFPDVGIQPATDGGLFAAGLFVAQHYRLPRASTPRAFLERIAISNWCKFTIKSDNNQDYIGDTDKLIASLPYVVSELATLRPRVVLLPKALWDRPVLQAAMRGASPWTVFLPARQFNATVVNTHLRDHNAGAKRLSTRLQGGILANWMAQLQHVNKPNAWRYFAELAGLMAEAASR
jgi:hypothetical protein